MGLVYGDEAMTAWVRHADYLRNCLRPGATRIDLQGNPAGVVSGAEQCHAWNVLHWVRSELMTASSYRALSAEEKRELRRALPKKPKDYDRYMFGNYEVVKAARQPAVGTLLEDLLQVFDQLDAGFDDCQEAATVEGRFTRDQIRELRCAIRFALDVKARAKEIANIPLPADLLYGWGGRSDFPADGL